MNPIIGLDHVQTAIPAGSEDGARRFYGDLVGLVEIPKPADMAGRGGCWFAVGALQLHLGVEAGFRPAKKAHIALACADLAALRARIEAAGYPTIDDAPVDGRERFFSEDPFGNRLEFVAAPTTNAF
jgi:predicted enzyme related to lactoylglutathione lyase